MKSIEGINSGRIAPYKEGEIKKGAVVYWMQRDQRAGDNWALLYAQGLAIKNKTPLYVMSCLDDSLNKVPLRHYAFMLKGLQKVEMELAKYNIPFVLLTGEPENKIPEFLVELSCGVLVADFNPLKNIMRCKQKINDKISIPFYEVDAHNVVPCRVASAKEEFGAYTIRPKINNLLPEYLEEFPPLIKMKNNEGIVKNDWHAALKVLTTDDSVKEVKWIYPGEDEALKTLQIFIDRKIINYAEKRNDPSSEVSSNLSPYLNFGQMAPQRAALAVQGLTDYPEAQKSFLEELIVRRELSDNFCFHNQNYNSFEGFPSWAKDTLNNHRKDKREYIYNLNQFEAGLTHDTLWNAAQMEMVKIGKMHGYMRMYWAKKILEWSIDPEDAMNTAIYLNDKYELDGCDPNGYAGIAWSIGGRHDRAWGERSIFGKIRYMNYNGCRRKFDVNLYINKISSIDEHLQI